ncbi:DUF1990 domain-containing protein [Microbacterium sp. X-17]|uniref:DUF1990 domain-containing protein n=1 Tax=Microbacterium sp. X-17 TaxID=3144404 RepID=UPI0031F55F6D
MTDPANPAWSGETPAAFRRSEVSAIVGFGDAAWRCAAHDVLRWVVKTGSGFRVSDASPVTPGARLVVTARVLGMRITEPVEVVEVVTRPDRVGFSYRTLPGHPVSGEEAFVVHRDGDAVRLTVRSLTRAAPRQPWRALYPLLRIAQAVARRRYLRALRRPRISLV